MADRFWLELRAPDCVPERKGPFPVRDTARIIREFLEANPRCLFTVVTVDDAGVPLFEDAAETLEILDGRLRHLVKRHRASSAAAFANTAS